MNSHQLRRRFLSYFQEKGHTLVPSSPVVPHNDPTLLFTNAGMNPFKDLFLEKDARDYKKAASSQKCIRVGGKHNDLENVGHTSRHLTFFEMLGNFSFGDYFKKEAIAFAWEVSTTIFGFPPEQIWPTVFTDDDEAFELWRAFVPEKRITRFGEKENFWSMGDTGPCGPCSELLFDKGPSYGKASSPSEDKEGNRFFEYWNLVFMQYQREIDGSLSQLKKPSIDTGAGLERVMSLVMGVDDVFATDILRSLIEKIAALSQRPYGKEVAPYHVIADHLRCLAFAIADGVQPSNIERGYVLRKVLRRAVRYGKMLGFTEPFLGKLLPTLVDTMGEDYPELIAAKTSIEEILFLEEEGFFRTLRKGGNLLQKIVDQAHHHDNQIAGDEAFRLKDTYGLPLEEILLLAKDAALSVDIPGYEKREEEARELSRRAHKGEEQRVDENLFARFLEEQGPSIFVGYEKDATTSTVIGIFVDGEAVDTLVEGQKGMVVLNQTPFYAEKGGQVGDTGTLSNTNLLLSVEKTQEPYKQVITHIGTLKKGELVIGAEIVATIDTHRRQAIANNHTATHLLHWALQEILGGHVRQAGSIVDASRLRFDFNHHKAVLNEEITAIEDLVNKKIRENRLVEVYEISYAEAQSRRDIKQFFGDKYDSSVRVIDIDFSKELCGGTHTSSTGNIGYFRIAKEMSIAAGVRRIEAVTGPEAEQLAREPEQRLATIASSLKTSPQKLEERIHKLIEENTSLQQEQKEWQQAQQNTLVNTLFSQKEEIETIPLIIQSLPTEADALRPIASALADKMSQGVVILGAKQGDKCHIVIHLHNVSSLHAGLLAKHLAPIIQGGGGGKEQQAQVGGKDASRLDEALNEARQWITKQIRTNP